MCEVAARGRFLVAERFFDARRASVARAARAAVARRASSWPSCPRGGRARVVEQLGSPRDIGAVLRGLWSSAAWGIRFPTRRSSRRARPRSSPRASTRVATTCATWSAITVDPPGAKDFDDAIGMCREGDGLRACVHIADVGLARARGTGRSISRRAGASCRCTCRAGSSRCCRTSCRGAPASLQEGRDRRALTVEVPFDAQLRAGPPVFRRSLIRSSARLTYQEAHDVLSRACPSPARRGRSRSRTRLAASCARGAWPAARSRWMRGSSSSSSTGRTSWGRSWWARPQAHALVEEFMLLANEAVATHLAATDRPTIYRMHEQPEPESIEGLVARLSALGVPTVPLPERLGPRRRRRPSRRSPSCCARYLAARTSRPRRPDLAAPALAEAGALRLPQPRSHRTCIARLLPLHLADPALPRPRRAPCAAGHARARHGPGGGSTAIAEDASMLERAAADVEHAADDICLAWLLADRQHRGGAGRAVRR